MGYLLAIAVFSFIGSFYGSTRLCECPDVPATPTTSISTTESTSVSTTAPVCFTIQVGSYKTEREASSSVRKLGAKIGNAWYNQVDLGRRGTWYRVYVGTFESSDIATKKAEDLVYSKRISAYIIKEGDCSSE